MKRIISILFFVIGGLSISPSVFAGKKKSKFVCEKVSKSGKHKILRKVKSKKKCSRFKGAQWIAADHEHDHAHGKGHSQGDDHDHSH